MCWSVQVTLLQTHPHSVTSVDDLDEDTERTDLRPKNIFHTVTLSNKKTSCEFKTEMTDTFTLLVQNLTSVQLEFKRDVMVFCCN